MSREAALKLALSVFERGSMEAPLGMSFDGFFDSLVTANHLVHGVITVTTTELVVPLGQVTTPGWSFWKNLDPVNYITIRNGSGAVSLVEIRAGEPACFPLLRTAAPWAIANTASCGMEYVIFSR